MDFVLKKFDQPLMAFSLAKDRYGQEHFSKIRLLSQPSNLPCGLQADEGSLYRWIKTRLIAKNRMHRDLVLEAQGLKDDDLCALIQACHLLSLNDPYWIVEAENPELWNSCSPYLVPFSEEISRIALNGKMGGPVLPAISPEMTTDGELPKMWRFENGKTVLVKGSKESGLEPFSEYYAAQILDHLGLMHVRYDLERIDDQTVSVCENFTSPELAYVSMKKLTKTAQRRELAAVLKKADALEEFADLVFADALMLNIDRHYGNFGLMQDGKTCEFVSLAPLFDHGLALFSGLEDLDGMEQYAAAHPISAMGIFHEDLVKTFCSRRHIALLEKMKAFHFRAHPLDDRANERLGQIEKWLKKRAGIMYEWLEEGCE